MRIGIFHYSVLAILVIADVYFARERVLRMFLSKGKILWTVMTDRQADYKIFRFSSAIVGLCLYGLCVYQSTLGVVTTNILSSIVAAYVFYLFTEFIPATNRLLKKKYEDALLYRNLQLILARVDEIFLRIYFKKAKISYKSGRISISCDSFYQEEQVKKYLRNFDLNERIPDDPMQITYMEYFTELWGEIRDLEHEIMSMSYVHSYPFLAYYLQYLVTDHPMNIFFKLHEHQVKVSILYIVTGYGMENTTEQDSLLPIKKLHHIAFKLYELVKDDEELRNIYPPMFYDTSVSNSSVNLNYTHY